MKKNTLRNSLVSLFVLGSTSAYGHLTYHDWLIGASGGWSAQKMHSTFDFIYLNPSITYAAIPATGVIQDYRANGGMASVFAGYEQVCRHWLVGIETEFTWQNINQNERLAFSDITAQTGGNGFGWSAEMNVHTKFAANASVRTGFVIDTIVPDVQVIPYLRVGVEANQQTLQVDLRGSNTYPHAVFYQSEKWPLRLLFGAGLEFPLNFADWSMRFEYVYRSRGHTLSATGTIIDNGIISPQFDTHINTETNAGKVAIVWHI